MPDVRERWFAGAYEITQGAVRDVELREGLYRTPAPRGENAVVAASHGELWAPKKWGAGGFILTVWFGSDASRAAVEAAYDEILRAVAVVHRRVLWTRHLADGTVRECYGELQNAVEPEPIGQRGMRCAFDVRVPAGSWQDAADTVVAGNPGAPFNTVLALTPFARATAPMDTLRYLIEGPVTNPVIRSIDDGAASADDWVKYSAAIPAGQSLTIDSGAWSLTGGGGLVVDEARIDYGGSRFLTVWPQPPGAVPSVRLEGTAGGAGTRLTVTGRARYLA